MMQKMRMVHLQSLSRIAASNNILIYRESSISRVVFCCVSQAQMQYAPQFRCGKQQYSPKRKGFRKDSQCIQVFQSRVRVLARVRISCILFLSSSIGDIQYVSLGRCVGTVRWAQHDLSTTVRCNLSYLCSNGVCLQRSTIKKKKKTKSRTRVFSLRGGNMNSCLEETQETQQHGHSR